MTPYFSGTSLISEVQKYHKEDFSSSVRAVENEGLDSFLYEQTGERREDAECDKPPKKILTLSNGQSSEELGFSEKSDNPLYEPI